MHIKIPFFAKYSNTIVITIILLTICFSYFVKVPDTTKLQANIQKVYKADIDEYLYTMNAELSPTNYQKITQKNTLEISLENANTNTVHKVILNKQVLVQSVYKADELHITIPDSIGVALLQHRNTLAINTYIQIGQTRLLWIFINVIRKNFNS